MTEQVISARAGGAQSLRLKSLRALYPEILAHPEVVKQALEVPNCKFPLAAFPRVALDDRFRPPCPQDLRPQDLPRSFQVRLRYQILPETSDSSLPSLPNRSPLKE